MYQLHGNGLNIVFFQFHFSKKDHLLRNNELNMLKIYDADKEERSTHFIILLNPQSAILIFFPLEYWHQYGCCSICLGASSWYHHLFTPSTSSYTTDLGKKTIFTVAYVVMHDFLLFEKSSEIFLRLAYK